MAEKKLNEIPLSYKHLGYDIEPVPGPSAPIPDEYTTSDEVSQEPTAPNIFDLNPDGVPSYSFDDPMLSVIPRIKFYSPPKLLFEDIYEACVKYAKKHSFYGSGFANHMKLQKIDNEVVFHYTLENYGEKRETITEYSPYKGEYVDIQRNGSTPNPWDIEVKPPSDFEKHSIKMEIPRSTLLENCSRCYGCGKESCPKCHGSGKKSCWLCSGCRDLDDTISCFQCGGKGKLNCSTCDGSTLVTCKKCKGISRMKITTFLVVTWQKHPYVFVSDTGNLPSDHISKAGGEILLEEKGEKLLPITECPDVMVNAATVSLLEKGTIEFPKERIVQQRHILQAIPLSKVTYSWNDKEGTFYVYGKERRVYFKEYPQDYSTCTCF